MKMIPCIKNKIDVEMGKINTSFKEDVVKRTKQTKYITELPTTGLNEEDILQELNINLELGKLIIVIITSN